MTDDTSASIFDVLLQGFPVLLFDAHVVYEGHHGLFLFAYSQTQFLQVVSLYHDSQIPSGCVQSLTVHFEKQVNCVVTGELSFQPMTTNKKNQVNLLLH